MKKIIFLLSLLGVIITGCNVDNVTNYDINEIVSLVMNNENKLSNVTFEGYKYYLPRGMTILDKNEYNAKILSNGDYYYLYVDIISYYHKIKIEYSKNDNAYFSEILNYKDKYGYIEIDNENNDSFFVKIVYNYAKIEVVTTENRLNDVILNSMQILSTIEYNDKILETLIGDNVIDYREEKFNLFESKRETGTFLDYVKEYDKYDDEDKIKDDDVLESIEQ